jgi:thymidine phosphorylase
MNAGIVLLKKLGDKITKGDSLMTLYTNMDVTEAIKATALEACLISSTLPPIRPLIEKIIRS